MKIEVINNKEYVLTPHQDTSAPCSHCVFFDRGALTCQHPDKENRHCKCEVGLTKGWNTLEYDNYIEFLHSKYKDNK